MKPLTESSHLHITQPWNDHRLKVDGKYVGCVTKEIADHFLSLQEELAALKKQSASQIQALDSIAFGPADPLAGNPLHWPSNIAYLALGGRIEAGKRIDSRETLLNAAPSN